MHIFPSYIYKGKINTNKYEVKNKSEHLMKTQSNFNKHTKYLDNSKIYNIWHNFYTRVVGYSVIIIKIYFPKYFCLFKPN